MSGTYRWKHGAPRVVFITGGSSGIGRDMARRLAAEGADIALFNRSAAEDVLAELRAAARQPAQRFACYRADVAQAGSIEVAVHQAVAELGAPDLAINSAGVIHARPLEEASAQDFDRVIDINLKGSRNFAAAVLPHLRPGSHLVFVASLAALTGNFAYTAYCASKFGVRGLAEEKRDQHPVSAALKAFAGSARLDDAVPVLLSGIARRRFEIVDGPRPALTAFLSRHAPRLSRRIGDRIAARALRAAQTRR